jgi:hypothetical protein
VVDVGPRGALGLRVRPQDVVPGVVAAFRVGDPPWSWFHIPRWLAAFGVNFATAALSGDLGRLRELFEAGGFPLGDRWREGHATPSWDADGPPDADD